MSNFNFSQDDQLNDGTWSKAILANLQNPYGATTTSASQDSNPQSALTAYTVSDIMQGVATYRPKGASLDTFNQQLSTEFEGLRTEKNGNFAYTENTKLSPYDTFIGTANKTNELGLNMGQSLNSANQNTGATGTGTTVLSGNGNEEKAWHFLLGKGVQPKAAAGMMGNIKAESGFEPRIMEISYPGKVFYNDRGQVSKGGDSSLQDTVPSNQYPNGQPGYGLVGFTSPGLKQGLRDLSAQRGVKAGDLGLQLDFLMTILGKVLDHMNGAPTPFEAARIMLVEFERPAKPNPTTRGKYAEDFYAQFNGR